MNTQTNDSVIIIHVKNPSRGVVFIRGLMKIAFRIKTIVGIKDDEYD